MVHVVNRQRHERLDRAGLAQLAQATLEAVLGPRLAAAVDVNLVFIGDNAMQRLNHTYRGVDAPTDVLSFVHLELPSPYTHRPAQRKAWFFSQPVTGLNGERPLLGEVLIATPTARRYAERHALTCAEEIQRLVIHGIIHLCGYDHETDTGQMTRLERRLRRRFLYAATNAPPAHQP
ncbi:rRNA maturation RNase YbeY [Chloracidobacterium sp. MS 40/45]|uniref:rRNA maturation RNase YbeY n=1 Tax=Chloracidobacterium aggregatum TaxID=2851959 RepID=UPI001B8C787A|nr:rRNA maturation RNase YbeY [Chloracidobacterium aggregatum]QUV99850.1 rRNA maturation RNase YbeY [Chloracidobacterium sp. MS 40/45]